MKFRLGVLCLAAIACAAEVEFDVESVAGSDRLGDGGPAVSALLSQPQSLAFDAGGNLYVADPDNHRVRKIAPTGVITTLAGTGHAGFRGDDGPADQARLSSPYGVAVDPSGNIYIADTYNHRIRVVNTGGIIRTCAGTGAKGSAGDGGRAIEAQLMAPRNVAVDANGNLFISEFEGHRVRKVSPGGSISTVAGTGVAGFNADGLALAVQLSSPGSMAVDVAGSLYITDMDNRRVRKLHNGVVFTVYGPVHKDLRTGAAAPASPSGVACDRAGSVFIAEGAAGRVLRLVNGEPFLLNTLGEVLATPRELAVDRSGSVFVSDGRRVLSIATTGTVNAVAGSGVYGFSGDGGLAADAQLQTPRGIALDGAGNLYVADTGNHRVRRVDPAGRISTVAGGGRSREDNQDPLQADLRLPSSVSLDRWGALMVSDSGNHRVRRLNAGVLSTIAGVGEPGRGGDEQPGNQFGLLSPGKSISDAQGNLYVCDTGNHRVVRITPAGIASTFAGNGTPGFAGDGGRAVTAQLNAPLAVAVGDANEVYIADSGNHRVRKITRDGVITTVAGDGISGVSGGRLAGPCGLAYAAGALFVSDSATVRRLRGSDLETVAGNGGLGYDGDGGTALAAQFNYPCDLVADARGRLWIADSGNHRIRRLAPRAQVVAPEPLRQFSVMHAASLREGPLAPGQIVSLFGDDLSGDIYFDGIPATLLHASKEQINVVAPASMAGKHKVTVEVRRDGAVRASAVVEVVDAAPALFTTGNGAGQALALNQDGSVNSQANPAARGSVVILYATGEGLLGAAATSVTIGGSPAELLFAGPAPDCPGLLQINARIGGAFTPGGILPLVLKVGSVSSPAGVTLAVK